MLYHWQFALIQSENERNREERKWWAALIGGLASQPAFFSLALGNSKLDLFALDANWSGENLLFFRRPPPDARNVMYQLLASSAMGLNNKSSHSRLMDFLGSLLFCPFAIRMGLAQVQEYQRTTNRIEAKQETERNQLNRAAGRPTIEIGSINLP